MRITFLLVLVNVVLSLDRIHVSSPGLRCDRDQDRSKFFDEADLGYLERIADSMWDVCDNVDSTISSLTCSSKLLYCEGKEIGLDFREAASTAHNLKYSLDVFKKGQIFMAKPCTNFNQSGLENNLNYMAALQSWAPELRNLVDFDKEQNECDFVESKPTIVLKLDAVVNMYHHFCDFLNLFLSLRIHSMLHNSDDLFMDRDEVQLLILDNGEYRSPLNLIFAAFSTNPLLNVKSYGSKRVCFQHLMLSMPPRMLFGLFYNTPLTPGCSNSSLINDFSTHIIDKLELKRKSMPKEKLRVTMIARQTQHRRVLNQGELIEALEETGNFEVVLANFNHHTDFRHQLQVILSTDILIGVHGAGLTHLLFLPNWATVFELYHCDDPDCYKDLARLRGIDYVTWDDEEKVIIRDMARKPEKEYSAYKKFANFEFDVKHFVQIVEKSRVRVLDKCKMFRKKDEL